MIKIKDSAFTETIITPTNFPDGTKLLKYNVCTPRIQITWLYDGDEELFQLIALTKHFKNMGCESIHLHMPYIPNARMDRVKHDDEVFTLKWFAEIINSLGFTSVSVVNPHSNVSEALFDRIFVDWKPLIDNVNDIRKKIPSINAIYYPDAGANKKFGDMLSYTGLPYMYGEKIRDWNTGQIKGLSIVNPQNCNGNTCLIVDDIISYGGSMYYSALELQKMGFENIYCYATHVENSILDQERGKLIKLDCVKKIYTTNSIFRGEHEKIEIIRNF